MIFDITLCSEKDNTSALDKGRISFLSSVRAFSAGSTNTPKILKCDVAESEAILKGWKRPTSGEHHRVDRGNAQTKY